jgi:hypothetical protein
MSDFEVGVAERDAELVFAVLRQARRNWETSRSSVVALPASAWAEAAISWVEAEVCSVEALWSCIRRFSGGNTKPATRSV